MSTSETVRAPFKNPLKSLVDSLAVGSLKCQLSSPLVNAKLNQMAQEHRIHLNNKTTKFDKSEGWKEDDQIERMKSAPELPEGRRGAKGTRRCWMEVPEAEPCPKEPKDSVRKKAAEANKEV